MENREEIKERLKLEQRKKKEEDSKKIQNDFEKIKNILQKGNNGKHNEAYIKRLLHEKENLRKVFLATIKSNPSRISEISEYSLLTKPTCYNQLHKLLDLNVVGRVYVLDVKNKIVDNIDIESKFDNWAENMPENLKRYYLAKTSYWVITDFGKRFAITAFDFDQEFKEKQERKEHGN